MWYCSFNRIFIRILIILFIVKALSLSGNETEAWLVRVIISWSVIGCLLHSSQFYVKPFGKHYEGNIPEYPKQLLYCLDNTCRHGAEVWVCVSNALRLSHFHTLTLLSVSAQWTQCAAYMGLFRCDGFKSNDLFMTWLSLFAQTLICPPDAVNRRTPLIPLISETKRNFTCSFDITCVQT